MLQKPNLNTHKWNWNFLNFFTMLGMLFLLPFNSRGNDAEKIEKYKREIDYISAKIDRLEEEYKQTANDIDTVEKNIEITSLKSDGESSQVFSKKPENKYPINLKSKEYKNPKNSRIYRLKQTFIEIQDGLNKLNNKNYRPNFDNTTKIESETLNKVFDSNQKKESTEIKQNRSYYLSFRPSIHLSNDLDYKFAHGPSGKIKTDNGYGLFLDLDKRIGSGKLGLSLGLHRTFLNNLYWMNNDYTGTGESTAYQLLLTTGYNFQLSDLITLEVGSALGFTNRHDHYELELLSPNSLNDNNLNFNGQLNLKLAFQLIDNFSLFTGYRFTYLGSSGSFGEMYLNSFEMGLGWKI
jgi:hypothetical protein